MLRTKKQIISVFRGGLWAAFFKNQEYGAFNAFVDSRAVTARAIAKLRRQV